MRLVDDARQAWRWWSVRAAAVAGVVAGWAVTAPQQVFGLIAYVPEYWRPAAGQCWALACSCCPRLCGC
jgi:hypothetical protein